MPSPLPPALATPLANGLRKLRRRYRTRLERCQRRFSETAVHDLRIETRRLLAMLDLLRALGAAEQIRKTRKVLKRRLDAFDELRDTHVCLTLLKPLRREFPEVRALDLLWRRRERELIGRLRRKIKRTRQARLQKRLKALEKELPRGQRAGSDSTANRLVLAAVSDNFATVVALRQSIRRRVPQTIHRARVAFKRFRYMCELLSPILPGATKPVLDRMRDYQTRMGEIQDNEVLLAAFQSAIEQEGAPVAIAGGVRAALLRRRRCLIESYLATADELFDFDPAHLSRPVS